jgi:hypothetical protein
MKKLFFFVTILMVTASCSSTKEARTAKAEQRKQYNEVKEVVVKQAVESRRFIVKLDRAYLTVGFVDLIPRSNYIIVDGKRAIIVAAYFGRQYDIKPIAGINIRGVANNYAVTSNTSKGRYEVDMKVANGSTSFDVNITIHNNGSCDAYVNGLKITDARYRGYLVPIRDKGLPEKSMPLQRENDAI